MSQVSAMGLGYDPQEKLFAVCEGKYRAECRKLEVGEPDMVKLLIDQGADVNKRDKYSLTALHMASQIGRYGVAATLLKHGADIRATDGEPFEENPFHVAVRCNKSVPSQNNQTRLIDYLFHHDKTIINVTNGQGDTALHIAADAFESKELIEYLISHGADVNIKNKANQTPMDIAKDVGGEDRVNFMKDCVRISLREDMRNFYSRS
jgi:serine/threonine-protein phosphatase 6 regulatory ankyrin repeat subunit A